jgi:hypothetical protein
VERTEAIRSGPPAVAGWRGGRLGGDGKVRWERKYWPRAPTLGPTSRCRSLQPTPNWRLRTTSAAK